MPFSLAFLIRVCESVEYTVCALTADTFYSTYLIHPSKPNLVGAKFSIISYCKNNSAGNEIPLKNFSGLEFIFNLR